MSFIGNVASSLTGGLLNIDTSPNALVKTGTLGLVDIDELSGGGGTATSPPATANELELQRLAVQISQQQLEALKDQGVFQQEQFDSLQPFLQQQFEQSEAAFAQQQELAPIQRELLDLELDAIRRGPGATDEQRALIEQATQSAIEVGESDISRFRESGIELLRTELAPNLGLRPGDTPIALRADKTLAEATRQQGQLISTLRGAQAGAELNFPLAAGQLQSARVGTQQSIATSSQQFLSQLRQQIVQNNLAASGQVGNLNLQRASVPFTGSGVLSSLSALRTPQTPSGGFAQTLGGIGGLLTGVAGVAALSSKKLKHNFKKLDHSATLNKVKSMAVERWNYRMGDPEDHIGPYAEEFRELFGVSSGVTINFMDAIGVLFSAVKGLNAKVEELENATS